MATSAVSSHGTFLKVGDGATPSENFTTIAEVLDISGPGTTLNTEDATNHDSGGWREPIPTILEGGEVTFDINYYKDSTQTSMRADMTSRTRRTYQMVLPINPAETLTFSGYVTNFEYAAPVEGILRASCTIMVTGPITSS
ncbi:MAG TPA: phage tail tube protein [Thermomicrobiales bacterium]|nr:phage tail tube protein [Thermomicrobiales bacterium]